MAITHRSEIDRLSPYVPGRPIGAVQAEYGLTRVVKLASNENPLGCSPLARQAAAEALLDGALYPDGACTALRAALADRLGVSPGSLVFGAGADEVISMIGKVFVSPGDECVTAAVTFSQYEAAVLAMGGRMVYAPMNADHSINLDAILERLTDKTKAVFIANPNNPTGTAFGRDAQRRFLDAVPPGVLVVLDEAYAEFARGADLDGGFPDTLNDVRNRPNVLLLKTFSKIYGLAGLRVGYGVGSAALIRLFENIRCPFNVSAAGQAAAVAALSDDGFLARSVENNRVGMDYYVRALSDMGVGFIPSHANFVMTDIDTDSRAAFEALMAKGYIARAGAAFGMDKHLRVTIGTPDDMRGFIGALKEVLRK